MELIKRIKNIRELRKYPTADKNASFFRLMMQGVPYYICRNGYSMNPLSVFIHVNSTCNLKCRMCDVGQEDDESAFAKNLLGDKRGDMPMELFKKIIDDIKGFKPYVSMPATEPLLYGKLNDAIAYAKEASLRVGIATNGYYLPERAKDLVDSGLTKLVVSIDGTRDVHDEIRGVEGTYDRIIEGIKKVVEHKKQKGVLEPYIYVNYVISDLNYDCILEAVRQMPLDDIVKVDLRVMFYCSEELAKKHNEVFGDKYDATTACMKGGLDLSKVDVDVLQRQVSEVQRRYPYKCAAFFENDRDWLFKYYNRDDLFLDNRGCLFPWFTAQISQDGDMWGPSRCFHKNYGNLRNNSFSELWNGPLMREFRMDLRKHKRFTACSRCEGVNY